MSKQTTSKNDKPTPPRAGAKLRQICVELAPAALRAAVLVAALAYVKRPQLAGD